MLRIVFEHLIEQIEGLSRHVQPVCRAELLAQGVLLGAREGDTLLGRQPLAFRPFSTRWSAEDCNDSGELVCFRSSRKQWPPKIKLCHDATSRKYVDTLIVVFRAKHQLWSPIPPSRHIFSLISTTLFKVLGKA